MYYKSTTEWYFGIYAYSLLGMWYVWFRVHKAFHACIYGDYLYIPVLCGGRLHACMPTCALLALCGLRFPGFFHWVTSGLIATLGGMVHGQGKTP